MRMKWGQWGSRRKAFLARYLKADRAGFFEMEGELAVLLLAGFAPGKLPRRLRARLFRAAADRRYLARGDYGGQDDGIQRCTDGSADRGFPVFGDWNCGGDRRTGDSQRAVAGGVCT